jgi:hypothetical protein
MGTKQREGKDRDAEEALHEWFVIVTGVAVRVSGPMFKLKAEELAEKLGHDDYKATDGWLSRRNSRHVINCLVLLKHVRIRPEEVEVAGYRKKHQASLL